MYVYRYKGMAVMNRI
jgi:hypothetical protein